MKKIIYFFLCVLFSAMVHTIQFIYPVFALDKSLYCIYQTSQATVHLMEYNITTGATHSALASYFNPIHTTLLPQKNGISFIDNGIVKIKYFSKRSPKSIECTEPLYNIRSIFWMDDQYGFINAQYHQRFGIFMCDYDGGIKNIIFDSTRDFFHAQKAGSNVFFIEKSCNHTASSYRVLKLKFDAFIDADEKLIQSEECMDVKKINGIQNEYCSEIINFDVRPIACLVMSSEREGFVIEHPSAVANNHDTVIEFKYHRIYEQNNVWHTDYLFTFNIPITFLFFNTHNRLHEGLFVLNPKQIGDYIYYSSCDGAYNNVNIYRFNLFSKKVEKLTNACQADEHYLCPVEAGGAVYCGVGLPEHSNFDVDSFKPMVLKDLI